MVKKTLTTANAKMMMTLPILPAPKSIIFSFISQLFLINYYHVCYSSITDSIDLYDIILSSLTPFLSSSSLISL